MCRSAEDCALVLSVIAGSRLRRCQLCREKPSTTRRSLHANRKRSLIGYAPIGIWETVRQRRLTRAEFPGSPEGGEIAGDEISRKSRFPDFPYGGDDHYHYHRRGGIDFRGFGCAAERSTNWPIYRQAQGLKTSLGYSRGRSICARCACGQWCKQAFRGAIPGRRLPCWRPLVPPSLRKRHRTLWRRSRSATALRDGSKITRTELD